MAGSEEYADYRAQLLPWEECEKRLAAYCKAVGLPTTAAEFGQQLRQQLTDLARQVDEGFPQNRLKTNIAVTSRHLLVVDL